DEFQILDHMKMGVQVPPRCVHPEVPTEGAVRPTPTGSGSGFPITYRSKPRSGERRHASDERSFEAGAHNLARARLKVEGARHPTQGRKMGGGPGPLEPPSDSFRPKGNEWAAARHCAQDAGSGTLFGEPIPSRWSIQQTGEPLVRITRGLVQVGTHKARTDDGDIDTGVSELEPQRLRETNQRKFRCRVGDHSRRSNETG